jgi:RND superfamily putative drug exporter
MEAVMVRTVPGFVLRRPLIVILVWGVLVVAGFTIGIGVFERLTPDVGTVPGSESAETHDRLDELAPRPETLTAIVTGTPAGDAAVLTAIGAAIEDIRATPGIGAVSDPLPSAETGEALLIEIALTPDGADASDEAEEAAEEAARSAADRLHAVDGATITVAGGPLSDTEFNQQAQSDVARAEMLSMPVVLILLFLVFGGLLAAGLPLLIAGVGVGATFGVLYTFSQVGDVSVYAIQITTMLAVGLAVDYALLMVNRFREERRGTEDVRLAVGRTVATAGRTVLFSGLTVAAALAGLVVFPDPFLRSMGLAGAAVVLVDMAAALTLLPALLSRYGHRISPAKPHRGGVFARVARGVQRRPVLTLVGVAGILLTMATPALGMQISQGDPRMLPDSTSTRQMWDELTTHFPEQAQWSGDIQVLARAGAQDPALIELRGDIEALPGIAGAEAEQLRTGLTLINAVPAGTGEDSASLDAVRDIRELSLPFEVSVGGDPAQMVDYRAMLSDRLPWAAALVIVTTLLLLFAFTGSITLPIKAVLTSMLSIGAAMGAVVWVFQSGHFAGLLGTEGLGYVHLTVPILIGAIAFGLSVDYEVFLLSRIREFWRAGHSPRAAVAEGLQHTGGIVTAAALVIAVVFAGFIVGGFAPIKAVGLGLVLAIVLDATVVRMLLVPAAMTLLGRSAWWLPKPLRRLHDRVALSEAELEPAPAKADNAAEPEYHRV